MAGEPQRKRRNPKSGVTLIEMLAALVIFSLIGIAGFSLLDQALRSRGLAEERLDRLGEVERTLFIFKQDLLGAFSAYAETDDETGLQRFMLQPSGVFFTLQDGTLFRGHDASNSTQAIATRVNSLEILAFPSGRPASQISLEDAEDTWAGNLGFQVVLEFDGVGTVEVVSPNTRPVPPEESEFGVP